MSYDHRHHEFLALVRQAAEEAIDSTSQQWEGVTLALNEKEFCPTTLASDLGWEKGGTIPQDDDIYSSLFHHMMINQITTKPWLERGARCFT